MKAIIKNVIFSKEGEGKFGKYYSFKVAYDDKVGVYYSKTKEQSYFVKDKEAEFTEQEATYKDKQGQDHKYIIVKTPSKGGQSNFGKALKKEQSKYSGFAVSYSKDLVVAGKLELTDLAAHAWTLFELMVEMDKSIEQ
jgi:hypothetical protein